MIYITFLFTTFIVLAIVFYFTQDLLLFTPTYYRENFECEECTLLSVTTEDGVELEGIVYEPKEVHSTLLVFVGRSHDAVGLMPKLAQTYKNCRIISFNYRSYGESQGVVNEQNMYADGIKIASLVQKNYGDFYLLGFSIGSVVAAFVAKEHRSLGVFLIGSFDSLANLTKKKYKIPLKPLLKYEFDTKEYVKNITAPTYLYASKDDEITYIQNVRNLKNYVRNLVHYQEFESLSHKDLLFYDGVVESVKGVVCKKV